MNRFDFFPSRELRRAISRQGTGDGLFAVFPLLAKEIAEEGRRELFGGNTGSPVSPVPRPLLGETDHPHWPSYRTRREPEWEGDEVD